MGNKFLCRSSSLKERGKRNKEPSWKKDKHFSVRHPADFFFSSWLTVLWSVASPPKGSPAWAEENHCGVNLLKMCLKPCSPSSCLSPLLCSKFPVWALQDKNIFSRFLPFTSSISFTRPKACLLYEGRRGNHSAGVLMVKCCSHFLTNFNN